MSITHNLELSELLMYDAKWAIFSAISWREQDIFDEKITIMSPLYYHAELDLYSVSWLKQQSVVRYAAPLEYIILIQSQSVFAVNPKSCVLFEEAANTNFIVFGLIRLRLECTIYGSRGEHANHYTTDAVPWAGWGMTPSV